MATRDDEYGRTHRAAPQWSEDPVDDSAAGWPGKRSLTSQMIVARKEDGAAVAPGARDLLDAAASSSSAPLPGKLRQKLETSLRTDLDGVRVHAGGQSAAAAKAVGAVAYTTGQDIHFGAGQYDPESASGQSLVAHEVAHTVQQRGATSEARQNKLEISSPGDAHEVEAEQFSQSFVSGQTATVTPVTQSSVARMVINRSPGPNPKPVVDNTGAATTVDGKPTLQDAVNGPSAVAPGTETRAANVKIVATPSAPLVTTPDVCPRPELIFQESPEQVSPAPSGFTTVDGFNGTVAAPQLEQVMTDSLYINGRPSADEVQQSGLGDCYFMAELMSVAQRDPGKIQSMMTPDGNGGASVTFWTRTKTNPGWIKRLLGSEPENVYTQVSIGVSEQLSYWLKTPLGAGQRIANGRGGFFLKGAQLHAAPGPRGNKWWSAINGTSMEVHRRDEYDTAMWAPLMEKAYAAFTEKYGQYGGSQGEAPAAGSGYTGIGSGGWSNNTMFVFYGAQADQGGANGGGVQQKATNWAPGSQILAANPAVVDQLLLLQGKGAAPAPGETQAPIITATAMVDQLIPRLAAAITAAQADPDWANVTGPVEKPNILLVQAAINTWTAAPADPPTPPNGPKAQAHAAIGTTCSTAITVANAPTLLLPARSATVKAMVDLVLDLKNIGTDNAPGQRNIFGNHVYSVMAATFVTTAGVPVPIQTVPSAMRPPFFPLVDTTVSQVTLRNPHHTNAPDPTGSGVGPDGPTQGAGASGIFHMSLDQFFRNYTSVESGVFPKS